MGDEGAAEGWYVRARGRVTGPLTWAQLQALRERGQLARFDQVSRDRQSWVAADSVERLFPRSGAAGAFVPTATATGHGPKRGPDPEPTGFLILDDEPDAPGPGGGGGARATAHPADEPAGWYYADAGMPQGPVAFSELKHLARDGRIGPGTLYWRSGLEQWTPGSDLAELNVFWRHDADAGAGPGRVTLPPRGRGVEPAPTAPAPRIEPLALVSLALNLFCGVGSVAAIIVGVMALRRTARSNGTLAGRGIALAGLAIGIAVTLVALALAYSRLVARDAG